MYNRYFEMLMPDRDGRGKCYIVTLVFSSIRHSKP